MTTRLLAVSAVLAAAAVVAVPAGAAASSDGRVPAGAAPADQPTDLKVGIDQKLGGQVNLDLEFRGESEQPVTLRDAMNGKVTILVPVYYRCPMLCSKVLSGLLDGLRSKDFRGYDAGREFTVVAVSMDPKEHADLGHKNKKRFVDEYGCPTADAGCRFLTGRKEAVAELLDSVGYRYEFDKAFKEFNHPSGIIVLTPEGKISRYFLGIGYDDADPNRPVDEAGRPVGPPTWKTLRLSLVEASGGKIGSLADQLLLTCYRFDGQGYSLYIRRVIQAGAVLTLLALGTGLFVAFRRERRAPAAVPTGETP